MSPALSDNLSQASRRESGKSAARPLDRACRRRAVDVAGQVQGVGFRPFVYRLARQLQLTGFVRNDGRGARLEVQGPAASLDELLRRLVEEQPPLARIDRLSQREITPVALADLGDGDNNHLLCLDTADAPLSVSFPAGVLTDPNDDLNPATSVAVVPTP